MMAKCIGVGDANPDIAGIGILLSFCIQAAFTFVISIVAFAFDLNYIKLRRLRARQAMDNGGVALLEMPKIWHRDVHTWYQLQETTKALLEKNSDIQTATGLALLVSALAQVKTLSFYHMHLVYDTVSLVAISNCAALVSSLDSSVAGTIRYLSIALWAILYLTYTSLFGVRLQSWDYNNPGHCYNTHRLSTPNAKHPLVDDIYISFTCLYVFYTLIIAAFKLSPFWVYNFSFQLLASSIGQDLPKESRRKRSPKKLSKSKRSLKDLQDNNFLQYSVISVAFLQFPLHAYSTFTLRRSNESLLNSSNVEQAWGFSQVGAMVLLAPNLIGIIIAVHKYLRWESREHGNIDNLSAADMKKREEDATQLEEDIGELRLEQEHKEGLRRVQERWESRFFNRRVLQDVELEPEGEQAQTKRVEQQGKSGGV
ncbi:uncharacterized protein LY89DRAFT_789337 [Mollisia scopiformis]|uniref:Uncharacterized protein n=1 Tax=Mollisia scopiformis TaxID=149040 RepID=A0A132B8A3_MOLSC|nr:uncharacterized protein LY89DRAFT_789337 [Mollisia scopiformis]KUJ08104.1 hypothetical protein LY89DRAFT_789337 [Mollisia scopiformis]